MFVTAPREKALKAAKAAPVPDVLARPRLLGRVWVLSGNKPDSHGPGGEGGLSGLRRAVTPHRLNGTSSGTRGVASAPRVLAPRASRRGNALHGAIAL